MRRLAAWTVLAAVLLATSACGGAAKTAGNAASPGGTAASGTVTINYWQYVYQSKVDTMTQLIKQFEANNPDIKVVQTTFPYDQYNNKVAAAALAGNGPDIVNLYGGWLAKYVDAGYLQPLPAPFDGAYLKSHFIPMVEQGVQFQGKYWALPMAVRTYAVFYNKDLFKAAGITQPPATWQEFRQDAIQLTKRDSSGKYVQEGFSWEDSDQGHTIFRFILVPDWGGQTYTNNDHTVAYNSPQGVQAFKWFIDLNTKDHVGDPTFDTDQDTAFYQGKSAMLISASFFIGTLKKNAPNVNWGVFPLPSYNGNDYNVGTMWVNAITKGVSGAKLQAAIKFLQFLESDQSERTWLKDVGEIPANIDLANAADLKADPIYGPFVSSLPNAQAAFLVDETAQRQILFDAFDAVRLKGADPATALNDAAAKEQKILDQFWAQHK
jgi:multiple sugar transport system substrate-binding protein